MLFVDERRSTGSRERPDSPNASARSALETAKGGSLRDLDLQRRLFRYPCSYMIYSEAFEALPAAARTAMYAACCTCRPARTSLEVSEADLADRQAISKSSARRRRT